MGMLIMRYPGGRSKALTLSYDDGIFEDIRLIDIMSRHGLKGTFNVNSAPAKQATGHRERLTWDQMCALYPASGNEVALHAWTHPHLEEMTAPQITYDVIRNRAELEQHFGKIIRGMAYPFGTYNDEVVNCLRACGIAYSRTVRSTGGFDLPTDWLRLPATCHHNDPHLMELADRFLTMGRRMQDPCLLFYLWGHSYEFTINDNWDRIEKFAEKMGGRDDIWYATNIEIYDYVQAYRSLRFSADGTMVENPTTTDVDVTYNGKDVHIPSGATMHL